MKPWFVIAMAACSSGDREERPAPSPSVPKAPRTSIDVTVTGAPVAIRGVEVQARSDGDLEVTYRAEAKAPALVPAMTMCRVGGRNLVYPMSTPGKVSGPRLSSLFRADPFTDAPSLCEVVFFYVPSELAQNVVAGRACYEAGTLRDGGCGAESFPPPELPSAGAIVLEQPLLEVRNSSAVVTALYTLTQPVTSERRLVATLSCRDTNGALTGESGLEFVPLGDVPVGASVYGPITFALERTPSADAECALQIVSRPLGDGPGGERVHAQYCLTTRTVRAGRC